MYHFGASRDSPALDHKGKSGVPSNKLHGRHESVISRTTSLCSVSVGAGPPRFLQPQVTCPDLHRVIPLITAGPG